MHRITLKGTPQQIGEQHGKILARVDLGLSQLDASMQAIATESEQIAMQYIPAIVDEMHAFADAAEVDYNALKGLLFAGPLRQNVPSCSVVAIMPEHTADGKLLVGRNYDFTYGISWDAATTYTTQPTAGYAHTGNCDIWIGREDGLNEAGLFAAMSAAFLPGVQAGLPFWFIVRHILETCANVDEALDWLRSVPHSQSRNYMLADEHKAVVAEATIDGIYVREPENGVLVMTNHPAHPALAAREPFKPDDSPIRYQRLRELTQDTIKLDDIKGALNDRENYVCAHGSFGNEPFGTIWSVIACPQDRQLAIAPGTGHNEGIMTYRSYAV